ncbi:MAG: AraC family transcriptional regulator [Candidatus Pelagadaptatus aseana]|uniref:AraC family transcriptional regulator n=1 Tax=Candidatus Pelagadaptatus aseana TaxID=3120508 RepID=UPI0039B1431F
MYLVRSGAIEGFASLVGQYQQNPSALLAEVGLSAAQLREPDALLSYARVADLLDITSVGCDDAFGLALSASQSTMIFGDLALFTTQQTSIRSVLEASQRYVHLHAMGVNVDTVSEENLTAFVLGFEFTNAYRLRQLIQLSAGHMWNILCAALGGYQPGLTLHLQQPPTHTAVPDHYHGQIVFNSHFDGVQFPTVWLERQTAYNESEMLGYIQRRMQVLENLYPDNLQAQVRHVISDLLTSGECTLERVSAALNFHPRGLQRQLAKSDSSFRQLLQQSRQNLAEHYLRQTNISITDLALNLGYAEVAVFSRHFKQWTGLSPRAWQQAQKGKQA